MSNLSELLPAGGAGKNVDFVASGTLPNGQAVTLKSDGTVEAVGETSVAQSIPLGSVSVVNADVNLIHTAFDIKSPNRVVVAYTKASNSKGYAVVGTISGSSISFGTEVLFNNGTTYYMALSVDPTTAGRFVVAYRDNSNSGHGTAIAGQISGTSISFGSETIFEAASINYLGMDFDTKTSGRFAIVYRDDGNSDYGTICIGTLSGTTPTFGTPVVYRSGDIADPRVAFDPNTANKLIVTFFPQTGSPVYKGYSKVGTLSGTSISFGSTAQFNSSGSTYYPDIAFDPNTAGKFVIAFRDAGNNNYGTAIIGTISGTSVSYGSKYVYNTTGDTNHNSIVFSPHTPNKFIIAYNDELNNNYGAVIEGTISGAAISFGAEVTYNSVYTTYTTASFDPNNPGKFIIGYRNTTASPSNGSVILGQVADSVTNLTSTNFLGIADAAIADGASGSVTIKGGVAASVSNVAAVTNLSAASVFANADTEHIKIAFDPNNANKCVICYQDDDNSNYGTAIVGTVSGTSISFGSEVVFNSGSTTYTSLAFDPNNSGKLVIAYADLGNSNKGTAVVGTVAGTSISFGSEVVFCTGETQHTSVTFNSSNTCVITYRNEGNSNYGEGIVGSVSGTSISFGTAAVFNSNGTGTNNVKADPNTANSIVVAYTNQETNPSKGGSNVGTVSGTSISWGSNQQFDSGETEYVGVAFDPNTAGKFVIVWRGGTGSDGASIIGNVSGTSISYGTKIIFKAGANQSHSVVAFDTNKANRIILSYGASQAYVVEGTITGNSIAWSTETKYGGTGSGWQWLAIDPSAAGKFTVVYQDQQDSSKGKVIMGQFSTLLAAGSDYYVQGNGTISTVSTSPAVKIGRALSSTKINLEFNT